MGLRSDIFAILKILQRLSVALGTTQSERADLDAACFYLAIKLVPCLI
jgi:hypothetical protein